MNQSKHMNARTVKEKGSDRCGSLRAAGRLSLPRPPSSRPRPHPEGSPMTAARPAACAAVALLLAPAGCKHAAPETCPEPTRVYSPAVPLPARAELPRVKVELSEPESEVVLERLAGRYVFGVSTRAKYRFVEG